MRHAIHLFFFLILPLHLFALYSGNPSLPMMPEQGMFISKNYWLGLKVGYEFDYDFNRHLHMVGQGHSLKTKRTVDHYRSLVNFGVITLNFNDRVEIFGDLGSMKTSLSHRPFPHTKITYHTHHDFAWGVGGRVLLAYWGDLQFGVNAAYASSNMDLSSIKVNGKHYSPKHANFDYREWQIGIAISYLFDWFIPYIGADFSDFRGKFEDLKSIEAIFPTKHATFKESNRYGPYLGFGFSPYKAIAFNFEARFVTETAVTASAVLKF